MSKELGSSALLLPFRTNRIVNGSLIKRGDETAPIGAPA